MKSYDSSSIPYNDILNELDSILKFEDKQKVLNELKHDSKLEEDIMKKEKKVKI